MTSRRPVRGTALPVRRTALPVRRVALPAAAVLLFTVGCDREVEGAPSPARSAATPDSPAELERLVVTAVPSGLPRLPDAGLDPPAGAKTAEDVAGYARDPRREREVLEEYGYRFGWERFWGVDGGALTSVFVHQHEHRAGAAAYARDLADNEAEHYGTVVSENVPELPDGCRLLTVDDAQPSTGLAGPAAISWCGHGVFSVSVTAVAGSVEEATAEVGQVLPEQLERLPPG